MPNKRIFVKDEDLKRLKEIIRNFDVVYTEKPSLESLLAEAVSDGVNNLWNSYVSQG